MPADTFAQQVARWQPFYTLAGTAAATLVGLLFIAVSLHLDLFTDEHERETRISAQQTLSNFFNIVVLALLFNFPDQTPNSTGLGAIAVGGISIIRTVQLLIDHGRGGWSKRLGLPLISVAYGMFLFRQVAFPLIAYGLIVAAGISIKDGATDAIYLLAALTIALLVGAGWNTWNLMVNLSRYRNRRNAQQNQASSTGPTAAP